MFIALFFRLLRLLVTSAICSLPIHLGNAGVITTNEGVLILSFFAFVIVTSIDAYRFSFSFWRTQDYFIGQLLPLLLYIALGFLTCLTFQPVVFNRIFLPLRFAGCLHLRTIESIVVVGLGFIGLVTGLRLLGARAGRLAAMKEGEDEDEDENEEPKRTFSPRAFLQRFTR